MGDPIYTASFRSGAEQDVIVQQWKCSIEPRTGPLNRLDLFIAPTAGTHEQTVVTRIVSDYVVGWVAKSQNLGDPNNRLLLAEWSRSR